MRAWIAAPWKDLMDGLDSVLEGKAPRLAQVMFGLLAGWWVYVPIHELSHAAACWMAGGEVSRLEIDPMYGGGALASILPWVTSGSEYAGRLSGFDTHGSDLRYLITDLGPFVWCPLGVGLLLAAARRRRALAWGFALPWAFAPFLSLPGDAYEMGSIVVTRLPGWGGLSGIVRGDDALAILPQAVSAAARTAWGAALLLGAGWAFAWYFGCRALASRLAGGEAPPATG